MPATRTRVLAEPWTLRVCESCRNRRNMPAGEVVCRHCAPAGGPRSYRLRGLREHRVRAGLSPEMLARRANLSEHTILRAERAGARVKTATAAAIAGALGASVSELSNERGDERWRPRPR